MAPSNLESFLRSFQADARLREFQEPVREELNEVDASVRRFFDSPIPIIRSIADHLLGVTGKKFRPTLLLLVSRLGEARREEAVFAAAVIELIHNATLVHDDTIDRSALRRGLPTINVLYNDLVSTILGDYIYTKAFHELLLSDRSRIAPVVARTTFRMSVGEMLQIQQKNNLEETEEQYFEVIDEKTASLISASCEAGALVAHLGDERVERFRKFGAVLGRAYQVTDDLFDYLASPAVIGKGVQSDLTEGKVTLPLIRALAKASARDRARLRNWVGKEKMSPEDWPMLLEILESSGALDYCRDKAAGLAEEALALLEDEPQGVARDALEKAVSYSVRRNH